MEAANRSHRSLALVAPEEFSQRVTDSFGDSVSETRLQYDHVVATVDPDRIVEVLRTLRDDPKFQCDYLTFLAGVDRLDAGFEVIITVYSTTLGNTVILKVLLPRENPSMPTITNVYGGAHWHERECFEMFGIGFDGHPNLRNLYLPDDFVGHPLLKSFRLASRTFKPWPGAKDPEEAAGGGR